jgi:hypothetical protein
LAYFLWTFGVFNLLNSGYLVSSAIGNGSDDWTKVIAGLSPSWMWRSLLGLTGATIYFFTIRSAAVFAIDWVNRGEVVLTDLWRLVLSAYLAGGAVLTIASVFNPISPSLIFGSGVLPSFGSNFGLLFLPRTVATHARGRTLVSRPMPFTLFWFVLGIAVSALFIAILGPGIRLSN